MKLFVADLLLGIMKPAVKVSLAKQARTGHKRAKTLGKVRVAVRGRLKFLVDTNIFVPLEPTLDADVEANTPRALELSRLVQLGGHAMFVHPKMQSDLDRDRNEVRRAMRRLVADRYPALPHPPDVALVETALGITAPSPNDHVDHWMLAGVAGNAVDYLITEDAGIRRKAARLMLSDSVLTLVEALDLLAALQDLVPQPPPHVHAVKVHSLNRKDPIFDSIRAAYEGFDGWWACPDFLDSFVKLPALQLEAAASRWV